jgi:antibiotic biosynthesis monooxygenase (ABM) superfamily enzyme
VGRRYEVKPALYIVTIEVAPGSEAEWNTWHEQVHIPEVLREPGFLSCRKWKDTAAAEDGWPRYVCTYELTGLAAVERYAASDAAKHLRAESERRFGYVTRHRRQVLSEVARFETDSDS